MNSYQKLKQQLLQSQMEVSHLKHEIRRIVIDKDEITIVRWRHRFNLEDVILFTERKPNSPFAVRGIIPLINKKKDIDE